MRLPYITVYLSNSACFALFTSIYWGALVSLAESADNVLEGNYTLEIVRISKKKYLN